MSSVREPSRTHGWAPIVAPTLLYNVLLVLLFPFALRSTAALDERGKTTAVLGVTLGAELIVLASLIAWLHHTGRTLADLGWGRATTRRAIVLGLLVALLYSAFTLASPVFGPYAGEISWFKAWGAFVGVIGGAIEELVFRGFVISELANQGVRAEWQVLVSGMLFALIHNGIGLLRGQWYVLPGIGLTFVLGTVLALIYLDGRRSLTPTVLSHALINLLIEPWLLLGFVRFMSAR
jgi:membrane protease YdiL (CAAX protease family)